MRPGHRRQIYLPNEFAANIATRRNQILHRDVVGSTRMKKHANSQFIYVVDAMRLRFLRQFETETLEMERSTNTPPR
jgi:hypothetical protein